jgi:hypothetical protein
MEYLPLINLDGCYNMDTIFTITSTGEIANRKKMAAFFKVIEPGTYLLTVKSAKQRSLPQNSYFHGPMLDLVLMGLRDAGFDEVKTKEDAKRVVKGLFLKRQIGSIETGEVIEIIRDTSELTTTEFCEFIADIQKWASEFLSVVIPDPGEKLEIDF